MRPRTPTAALIKKNNTINRGIKIPAHRRAAPATGTAMQNNHRYAIGLATLLHIYVMPIAHAQNPLIERLNRWIKKLHCAFLTCDFVHNCPI
jgi:hypothetical protein